MSNPEKKKKKAGDEWAELPAEVTVSNKTNCIM